MTTMGTAVNHHFRSFKVVSANKETFDEEKKENIEPTISEKNDDAFSITFHADRKVGTENRKGMKELTYSSSADMQPENADKLHKVSPFTIE